MVGTPSNLVQGQRSTCRNGQIRSLIKPSLIGPWTRLIGVLTVSFLAVIMLMICPHQLASHLGSGLRSYSHFSFVLHQNYLAIMHGYSLLL